MLETVGNGLVLLSTVLIWSFVISYQVMAPWQKSGLGKLIMASKLEIALVLSMGSARILLGATLQTTWFEILRIVVFSGVPIMFIAQLVALYRFQPGEFHRRGLGEENGTDRAVSTPER